VVDDDDSDVFVPEPMEIDEPEDDIGSLSAEDEDPSASPTTVHSTPEPVLRKPAKSKLSKFTATPASSSPASTTVSTPRPALGAFGQPLDKTERLKNFTEKNKDRYSWLLDVRDKDRNRPGDENYDPRSLYIPPTAWKAFTAFERQYWEVKQNLWDTVLFFQKGKFFELYENDATIGHQQFDLKLTDRTNMRFHSPKKINY
jgi:DNA mismatch repair protein MSH6